jgi:hypothetical protein
MDIVTLRSYGQYQMATTEQKQKAEENLAICSKCEHKTETRCGYCKCPLIAKLMSYCPHPEKKF